MKTHNGPGESLISAVRARPILQAQSGKVATRDREKCQIPKHEAIILKEWREDPLVKQDIGRDEQDPIRN